MSQSPPRPRSIFLGSPDFAVPCLRALAEISDVALCITQPDKPAGRGLKLRPPAVKVASVELGIECIQPRKVRDGTLAERMRAVQADVAIVVAYGRILPREVLDAPRLGCLNVHASILPRWRGAAPINWAVVAGDDVSGVTLMRMDEGLDTGPTLATREISISAAMTAGDLNAALSELGGSLLREALPEFLRGSLVETPQNDALATKASLLTREHGRVVWSGSALEVHNHIRGFVPWPGAWTVWGDKRVKLHQARVDVGMGDWGIPGTVLQADARGLKIACGPGILEVLELQLEGRKRMSAMAFVAGKSLAVGDRFGQESER